MKYEPENRAEAAGPLQTVVGQARLRQLIERPQPARLWGQEYTVTPAMLPEPIGDGRRLIWVSCANTRPHWYVVRVDSSMRGDALDDAIDDVILALQSHYGDAEHMDDDEDSSFPVVSDSSGYSWGREPWPC